MDIISGYFSHGYMLPLLAITAFAGGALPAGENCPEKALCQERNDLMQGILFAEKPRAQQLYLDARTKIILCLTVSFLMFSCEYTGVMFVLPVLAAVPFVSFLILRRYRKAAVYGMVYVLCLMLPMLLRQLDAPVFSIISGALAAIFTQMLPGLAMFDVLLSSTTVSEFIGAMNGFHISKKFSVPVSVMVNGNDTTQLQLHELAGTVGSVFQNPKSQFYTLLTDTEIVFACENIGMEKREILRRFTETVQDFRLEKLLGKNVSQLSGGEKQKIACASVSMLRPPILVLDEPTSNLDISAIRELREIVAKWKATGKTVLIAEHRLWWLRGLADRVVVFQEGSIVEDIPADEFWRRTPDELHAEGLCGSWRFAPQVKERCADAQYIISSFCSSDGEFTLNIPELKIPKGAVVAVLGNNGAGKSTFARCLCGLVRKCKVQIIGGEKRYAGRKLSSLAYMVFQDVNHQLFSESVSEDGTLGLRLSEDEKRSTAEEMLWRMELWGYREAHPMALSGGQKQRLAIAGALAAQKDIIFYDEPTSGLDYRNMERVAENIRRLSEMGKTQFVITHDPELVEKCCDRFLFFENGKITDSGSWTAEALEQVRTYFVTLI